MMTFSGNACVQNVIPVRRSGSIHSMVPGALPTSAASMTTR